MGVRGITWEPDPRHAELTIQELGLADAKPLKVPGRKPASVAKQCDEDNGPEEIEALEFENEGPVVSVGFRRLRVVESSGYDSDESADGEQSLENGEITRCVKCGSSFMQGSVGGCECRWCATVDMVDDGN